MPWVRLDEDFAEHPKVVTAGPLAMAMHVAGLCYANRNSTDGRIPRPIAKRLIDLDDFTQSWEDVVADLLTAGMWTETEQGFEIHDYLEYQPSKADVEAKRADLHAKRAAAGRKGAEARWDKTPGQNGKHGKPDGKRETDERQAYDPDPVPVPPNASSASVGFTAFHADRAVEAVRDRQRKGLPVKSVNGLAKTIQSDPDFLEESKRIWAHRDCEKCDGKGFTEEYSPGAGTRQVECKEAT